MTDLAQVFSAEQRTRLIKELADFERETSHQMAVLTVPTLSGERIEDFSLRVANDWGLGQKGKDNGILVTLALKERQVRIEIGKGLESDIPQETLDRIIRDDMVPAFRQGDYASGLEKGVRRLQEVAPRSTVALRLGGWCPPSPSLLSYESTRALTNQIFEPSHPAAGAWTH